MTRLGSFSKFIVAGFACAVLTGCQIAPSAERFGKIFYLDGAGNWGDGAEGVANGVFAAGFQGDVEEYVWTTSYNPLVDQLNLTAAKLRSEQLADKIRAYRKRHPDAPLHVVALSAGTGVATWAIELLDQESMIDHFVLLGSSLSHDYDLSSALSNMRGNIYVYYSPHDVVLEAVRTIGTIDGKRGVESVGYVGVDIPQGLESRIFNTPWSRDWLKYGWTGAHQDCVNAYFVRFEIARQILPESTADTTRLASYVTQPGF
ncbi:MAG: esterase/lipase family protein [Phycisphaerae bacterium]